MSRAPHRPHRVVVLAVAPVIGYDLAIPPLFFGEARDEAGRPLYDVTVAGLGGAALATSTGYTIVPAADESALATADTVVVPGTRVEGPRWHGTLDPDLGAALALVRPGTRIMSICTGAFVLAAAGMLDGRRATTHWSYLDDFARLYPQVDLDPGVLFVDDGDLLSSAGLAAGADLCLHVIRQDHGAAVANAVARHCVVPPWRDGGQAQFIERAVPTDTGASTAAARAWALAHLGEPIDNATWARTAHLSLRTFNRRFVDETGRTPRAWLIDQRVDRARVLLETTDLDVDRIATEVGLGTSASLRAHLRERLGVSPSSYRRTFRGA
jgi:transcriptional regulator GlxA family with amidase domain